jgi:hypothetical protein
MCYGIKGHMMAALIFRLKHELDDGAIVEMVIWRVPQSVPGSHHGFKYRLYFGKGGKASSGTTTSGARAIIATFWDASSTIDLDRRNS